MKMDGDRLQEFCSRVENTKQVASYCEILSEIEGAKVDELSFILTSKSSESSVILLYSVVQVISDV